jgi:endonuclease/exonuclease/phosphatase (EEP) superfamily protein YafD
VNARPLAFGTGVLCLATLLAYGGRWSWACEVLVNLRSHLALLLVLALVIAAVLRHWRIAGVAAAGFALNVWPMIGIFETAAPPGAGGRAVRVVAFNVNVRNTNLPGIATYLDSLAPDVVVLEEVTTSSVERLVPLLPRLAHHFAAVDEGVRGVLILSRWPLVAPQLLTHGHVMYGARADVDLGDRQFRLYGVHLNWPVVMAAERERNAQLGTLGRELAECRGACVAVGDFNITPWSSHFRDVVKGPAVRDCAAGHGWLPTWNSGLPSALRIRIDQCLASGAMGVADVHVGESAGSDHFATINDLSINDLSVADATQRKTPLVRGSRPTTENAAQGAASVNDP